MKRKQYQSRFRYAGGPRVKPAPGFMLPNMWWSEVTEFKWRAIPTRTAPVSRKLP